MFWNLEDAQNRLNNTLIRTNKGHPIVVIGVHTKKTGQYMLDIEYLNNKKVERINLGDADLSPVPLGNVNVNDIVIFVSRQSMRLCKQGLSNDNMQIAAYKVDSPVTIDVHNKALMAPIINDYPSIFECYHNLLKGDHSQAFSRMFSLYNKTDIIYRSREKIGSADKNWLDNKSRYPKINLLKDFFYLEELLKEVLNDPS